MLKTKIGRKKKHKLKKKEHEWFDVWLASVMVLRSYTWINCVQKSHPQKQYAYDLSDHTKLSYGSR